MNAPKKIWLSKHMDWDDVEKQSEEDIAYVRADIVDGLVEALEHTAQIFEALGGTAFMAIDALKALESAEIGRGME